MKKIITALVLILLENVALAQAPQPGASQAPQPGASQAPQLGATLIPFDDPTQFYRVESGLFQVQAGQPVDLGDRYLTFTFRVDDPKRKRINVYLGGYSNRPDGSNYWYTGNRLTLNKNSEQLYGDKRICFLDYLNLIESRGGPSSGVFRFICD